MYHSKSLLRAGILLWLICFPGCSSVVKNPAPLSAVQSQSQIVQTPEYRIQPGDLLEIKFFYNEELNEEITVRPDGRISLQLAHDVMAAYLTVPELTNQLKKKYETDVRDPEITVFVRSFSSRKAYVGGEVVKPQVLELESPTTVLQAIARAQGFTENARVNDVVLIRRNEIDGSPIAVSLDIAKAIDGTDPYQDVTLKAFDIIHVPKSPIANVNKWVKQYIVDVLPLKIYVNFPYNISPETGN